MPLLAHGQSVPSFEGIVNDQAQMLPRATRLYLKQMLEDYRAQTGHQLTFLSVDSLHGLAPEVFALKVVESWKLGRALADDGLLLLIANRTAECASKWDTVSRARFRMRLLLALSMKS